MKSEDGAIFPQGFEYSPISRFEVMKAYQNIESAESPLMQYLIQQLMECSNVQIIHEMTSSLVLTKLPIVCFTHRKIKSRTIIQRCIEQDIIGRHGFFLSSRVLNVYGINSVANDTDFLSNEDLAKTSNTDGAIRFSIVHYNNMDEIRRLVHILKAMKDWN